MSNRYVAVQWNRHKIVYDACAILGIAGFVTVFMLVGNLVWSGEHAISPEIAMIRALGTCAIVLLHVILCIGPLCRLSPRFLPLLYNRRHLGVMTFIVGLAHALLATVWYGAFGVTNPVAAFLSSNTRVDSLRQFPFEWLGMIALVVLFFMAATSHDFWLKNLSPRVWKWLHMLVYVAWGALVMHVALGAMQSETAPAFPMLVMTGVVVVGGLHLAAGVKQVIEARRFKDHAQDDGWIDAGLVDDIPESLARTIETPDGERLAVFRYGGKISAVSNRCVHQGGPLGEGKVVGGCVTCPWHGYQYRPEDGCSPPPYSERIPTHRVQLKGGRVLVEIEPQPLGTRLTPATIGGASSGPRDRAEGADG